MSKQEIKSAYKDFVKENKRYPTRNELKEYAEISRDQVRDSFGNYEKLKKAALEDGDLKDIILDVELLDESYIDKCLKKLSKYKRFVITTAVTNSKVNKEYYKSLKTYCKEEDACLIVIPSLMKGLGPKWNLDPILKDEVIMFYDYRFNSNIQVLGVHNNAKATDPLTGLPRLGKRNKSLICGSPKQNMKVVPTGVNKLPHVLMSSGSITNPEYISTGPMLMKQDYLADNDHVLGAIILELDKHEMFHYRQTQADNKFGVTDMGYYYHKDKKEKYSPDAMVLGDWHTWETHPVVAEVSKELSINLKIKEWIVHDLFTGLSVNPYEAEKRILLAKRAAAGELNIENEIRDVAKDLNWMVDFLKKVTVVRSNHDDFIDRYLETGAFVNHPYNLRTCLLLGLDLCDGKNPLEEHCRRYGISDKVTFLKRDESYQIAGIELGQHFDKGQNGARASLKGLEESYGAAVGGHSHTPGILRSVFQVGTSTHMQLTYNQGASSWLNTHCLVYDNGVRQLINIIDGKYTNRD